MKRPPFVRQSQALGSALDQPHAKALLEFGHPARQRRLGSAGDAAGAAETAMGGNEIEVGQGLEIHRHVPILRRVVSILASPAQEWNGYLSLDTHQHSQGVFTMAILVTGSTGTIGSQVLAHLQGRNVEVRALTRSPETAQLPAGVTAVRGDLADPDSVRAALQGVSTLFLLAPNVADELTQAMLTLTVAREAGVKGIVYLSVFGGDGLCRRAAFRGQVHGRADDRGARPARDDPAPRLLHPERSSSEGRTC